VQQIIAIAGHFVNESCCILNAALYFDKGAKIIAIYQICCELFCCFIDGIRDKYVCNEVAERRSSALASKRFLCLVLSQY